MQSSEWWLNEDVIDRILDKETAVEEGEGWPLDKLFRNVDEGWWCLTTTMLVNTLQGL